MDNLKETGGAAVLPTEVVNQVVAVPAAATVSKFDPARLRVSQSFGELVATRKVLTSVPVTKPNKQQWVRVHPEVGYRESFALIEEKESRTMYLVEPSLVYELSEEVIYVTLHTAMTREGTVFLWPVRLPDADGRPNSWYDSAREAAAEAVNRWVRVVANMSTGGYDHWIAPGTLAEPEWPATSYSELLSIAFKGGRFIDTLDHPLVSRLKGVK
ncbi:MAG TPA: hypothetical protein VN612_03995 [Acidobacteriaceae bacterium]|nr:hypothetical protein [Acidobacteriaceae bacterium]